MISTQEHLDEILGFLFDGEVYYIEHPDPDGRTSSVAATYAVFSIIGGETFQDLEEGDTEVERMRVQISIYATDTSVLCEKVRMVKEAMRGAAQLAIMASPEWNAMSLFNYPNSVQVDGREIESRRYYSHLDYNCWYRMSEETPGLP